MICSTVYNDCYDGLSAFRHNNPCSSSNISFEPISATKKVSEEVIDTRFTHFLLSFYLSSSMATISSGLSIKKKRMKAKFNREAYAKSIQESANIAEEGASDLYLNTFERADYSFHIKETAGKVLDCSKSWYK